MSCEMEGDASEREQRVCDAIRNSQNGIRFNALKNETGLHQEILTRIIRRNTERCSISNNLGKYEIRDMSCCP
jgi:hypothetical protein